VKEQLQMIKAMMVAAVEKEASVASSNIMLDCNKWFSENI
jgi:hypothetical protein